MTTWKVNLGELSGAVDDLDRYDRNLKAHLDHLDAVVESLHAVWTGEAADAHAEAHDTWKSGAAEMRAAAAHMRQCLTTAHSNYEGIQQANKQMWAQFE